MLRLWYHAEAKRRGQSTIDLERRRHTFDEVVGGLDAGRGALRGAALPVVRQLLRVRRLLLGVPRAGRHQAGPGPPLSNTTWTSAPAARSATTSARAARSRWSPEPTRDVAGTVRIGRRRSEQRRHGAQRQDARWQRGGRLDRLPRERDLRDLSDHALLDDGRAGRPVGVRRQDEHLGRRAARRRDAERRRRRGRRARRACRPAR